MTRTPISKPGTKSVLTTVGLLAGGSVMAVTGLTLLSNSWGFTGIWKAWKVLGLSPQFVANAHQVGAITFLTAAGVHITSRQSIIKNHLQTAVGLSIYTADKPQSDAPATAVVQS